ncbi:MAG: hypothetical protein N2235_14145, partial [Fischerella sp.]|nr:hypothetical protein [Fischerella sp.]
VLFVVSASARKRQLRTPQSCFGKPLVLTYLVELGNEGLEVIPPAVQDVNYSPLERKDRERGNSILHRNRNRYKSSITEHLPFQCGNLCKSYVL